jgi:hypothetical protein
MLQIAIELQIPVSYTKLLQSTSINIVVNKHTNWNKLIHLPMLN